MLLLAVLGAPQGVSYTNIVHDLKNIVKPHCTLVTVGKCLMWLGMDFCCAVSLKIPHIETLAICILWTSLR